LDLSNYAGKNVLVEFSLAGEKKGLWGYWGSPVVRGHVEPVALTTSASGKRKPHGVILLVTDTLRKDHLNIYGYPRETLVHLKQFAAGGAAFNHAISQATMTKISVPSIVTSLYPLSHTVLGFDHGLPASAKTIAEVFRDEGYATVAYSSVPFTGKMNNMHQGYDELHEVASISDPEYHSKTARPYVDRLIPWLEDHRDAPFFVFLHVFDPHSPFRPRPPYDTIWGAPGAKERLAELEADMKKFKIQTSLDNLPPKSEYLKTGNDPDELLRIYMDWYDGSIRGVDAEIGRLLEALRTMGLEEDTLMVWSADHGEEFWEHGRLFHGQSVYGELNQVPMVYRWPNGPDIRKGVMIDQQVQNLDIMPTILELAGVQGPSSMQGKSLVPLLNGSGVANWQEQPAITQAMVNDNVDPRPATMGGPAKPGVDRAHFGIIDHGWKLVRKELEPEPQQELYQHPVDDLNLTNVIKSDGVASRLKSLTDSLESWKTKARAAQLPSDDTMAQQVSSEELRRLRALGYVGGGTPAAPATNKVSNTNTPPRTGP
jgi:arylsulfatase A-like enzyme